MEARHGWNSRRSLCQGPSEIEGAPFGDWKGCDRGAELAGSCVHWDIGGGEADWGFNAVVNSKSPYNVK